MSTVSERAALKNLYPSPTYAKTIDKMSDSQVIAIVRRLQGKGKL